ncbi:MAG: hypothetical protein C5B48_15940 [Candidatus Rokuibacteriota bacterium]|nr:MAG: hypothetical protein C5B48_15940 [Candidatus Rokubacteria bacterium]
MNSEFVRWVSAAMLVTLVPLVAGAAFLGGRAAALGGLAGGLISLGSFRWIASGVRRAATGGGGAGVVMSSLGVGARHLLQFGALALVLWSGAAHPIAVLAGLSVLPPILIVVGLRNARLR